LFSTLLGLGYKIPFIFLLIQMYGSTPLGGFPSTETTPYNPPPMIAARPANDKEFTDAGAIVIRPGVLYGRYGSHILASLFQSIESIAYIMLPW
jgi:hypothetical protein